jgi:HAD superfamily phosphoserine phosphatase-like hydrolase
VSQRFAVFDLDGTVFRWQLDHAVLVELEDMGVLRGFRHELQETYTAWQNRTHPESFEDYASAFDAVAAEYLRAVPVALVSQAARRVVARSGDQVYSYTRQKITDLRSRGYALVAISGSLRQVVQPFAELHGFDSWRGQDLGVAGKYFARPYGSFAPGQKGTYLRELQQKQNYTLNGSVGVGDTMSDASMLEAVERPIVFNPDRRLLQHAQQHGWDIVVERKNVILTLTKVKGSYRLEPDLVGCLSMPRFDPAEHTTALPGAEAGSAVDGTCQSGTRPEGIRSDSREVNGCAPLPQVWPPGW